MKVSACMSACVFVSVTAFLCVFVRVFVSLTVYLCVFVCSCAHSVKCEEEADRCVREPMIATGNAKIAGSLYNCRCLTAVIHGYTSNDTKLNTQTPQAFKILFS